MAGGETPSYKEPFIHSINNLWNDVEAGTDVAHMIADSARIYSRICMQVAYIWWLKNKEAKRSNRNVEQLMDLLLVHIILTLPVPETVSSGTPHFKDNEIIPIYLKDFILLCW